MDEALKNIEDPDKYEEALEWINFLRRFEEPLQWINHLYPEIVYIAEGTGFFISPDILVTTYHTIDRLTDENGRTFFFNPSTGEFKFAKVLLTDREYDLAIFKPEDYESEHFIPVGPLNKTLIQGLDKKLGTLRSFLRKNFLKDLLGISKKSYPISTYGFQSPPYLIRIRGNSIRFNGPPPVFPVSVARGNIVSYRKIDSTFWAEVTSTSPEEMPAFLKGMSGSPVFYKKHLIGVLVMGFTSTSPPLRMMGFVSVEKLLDLVERL